MSNADSPLSNPKNKAVRVVGSRKILMPGADSDNRRVHLLQFTQGPILVIETPLKESLTAVPYPLAEAQILELSGTDACAFAHSQFTSDVIQLNNGEWQWSAWLDAVGRVRSLFALLRADDDHLLAWLPRGQAASMAVALLPFVFRSKVRIQPAEDYGLFEMEESGNLTAPNSADEWTIDLPGGHSRRTARLKRDPALLVDVARHEAWAREDIAAGLPWISAENSGEFTPHALGLDRLDAISLKKGCYPGQEIVARLHYRGGNKRECVRLQIDTEDVPMPGTEIRIETTPPGTGRILYAIRSEPGCCEALSVLPLNRTEGIPLSLLSGIRVTPLTPINHMP